MPTILASQSGQIIVKIKFGGLELAPNLARYDQATIDRPLNSWLVERHALKFVTLDTWRQAYQKLLDCDRRATVQFGLNLGGRIVWQPEEDRYVIGIETDGFSANSSQYGPTVVVIMADMTFQFAMSKRLASYTGNLEGTLGTMTGRYGIGLEYEKIDGRSVNLIQSFQSDYDFLLNRICPRLVSAGGLSGYVFYQRDNQLYVHTAAWEKCRTWSVSVGTDNAVTDWSVTDKLGLVKVTARDGVNLSAYDPLTSELADLKTSNDNAPKFSSATWAYSSPRVASAHVGINGREDELAQVQHDYAQSRLETAGAKFVVVNEPGVSPGDLVNVSAPGKDPGAGSYMVKSVNSELTAGNLRSLVTLVRSEVALTGSAPGVALPAPQDAKLTLVTALKPGG